MKCKRDKQMTAMSQTIGNKIRWMRYRAGMGLKEVADSLNISIPALSKIEKGVTDIGLSRLEQISRLFKVKPSAILDDEEPAEKAEGLSYNLLKEKLTRSEQEVFRLQKRLLELYEGLEKYITSK